MNTFKIYEYTEKASGLFGFLRRKGQKAPLGEIVFHNDKIVVAGKEILLAELQQIRIPVFHDYYGRNDRGNTSQGDNNLIELLLMGGNKETYYFALSERYEVRSIKDQLITYYKAGKFEFDNLTLVLGLEDYNAVLNFKRSLTSNNLT
ncbi:hypothetical protein ABS768_11000 [Flavobacterium sp. ST-75]|uniref:Uncharacterized protein n=1 Tax=Flavobacterium rhizophilum TaxID=3163296 RepID=A0ABW8YDD6_9FLAO